MNKKSYCLPFRYDYLIIESTGISEPLPVAQTFIMNVDQMSVTEPQKKEEASKGKLQGDSSTFAVITKY